MAEVQGEIVIHLPPDEVFDFVADEENEPRYNPQMQVAKKVTEGPIGVGKTVLADRLAARLDGQRQAGALAAALRELPDHLREVVVLRCTRELSFAEIAEVTGCPQGTLKSRFHRATQALKQRLGRRGAGGAR